MSRLGPLLLVVALVALWEAACVLLKVPTLVAPRPGEVALVL